MSLRASSAFEEANLVMDAVRMFDYTVVLSLDKLLLQLRWSVLTVVPTTSGSSMSECALGPMTGT